MLTIFESGMTEQDAIALLMEAHPIGPYFEWYFAMYVDDPTARLINDDVHKRRLEKYRVNPWQWHVTIRRQLKEFDRDRSRVAEIIHHLSRTTPIRTGVENITYRSLKHESPKFLYLLDTAGALDDVNTELEQMLEDSGLGKPNQYDYTPHISIAQNIPEMLLKHAMAVPVPEFPIVLRDYFFRVNGAEVAI